MRSLLSRSWVVASLSLLLATSSHEAVRPPDGVRRNVIIFVADGLRHGSVNATDSPALLAVRREGVDFSNSHALFPTFTTPNASAIATGHLLGDTGDFGNDLYLGYALFGSGNFGADLPSSPTPFLESDQILGDLNAHFHGNYLHEATLLAAARQQGYEVAVVGKLGPAGIEDAEEILPCAQGFCTPAGIAVDDKTGRSTPSGHPLGLPLRDDLQAALKAAHLDLVAPDRSNGCGEKEGCNNGFFGDNAHPGTTAANTGQQRYFANAVTKAILPLFRHDGKPFLLVYWSRDPDGTQHNQGDSLHRLAPGIDGCTSRLGVRNADDDLQQILELVHSDAALAANTDVIVTSDHGFATISRGAVDRDGHRTRSYSAQFCYRAADGSPEIPAGSLPSGFLAIDLAKELGMRLYDADQPAAGEGGLVTYPEVDPADPRKLQRPKFGNGLLGDVVRKADASDAKVIVAANGGSDLVYVPDGDRERVVKMVRFLAAQDYVGGLFVDGRRFGRVPGALALADIGLDGGAVTPVPAIVVAFKVFDREPGNPQSAVQISDTTLQEGQGMHGGFGRDSTFNNMAAIGPDFKPHSVDAAPAGNADIAWTVAHLLGVELPSGGALRGRILFEALKDGPMARPGAHRVLVSASAAGRRTVLEVQQWGEHIYYDRACFVAAQRERSSRCPF